MGRRRKCKLANSDYKQVDLRRFSQLIIDTVEATVPGKNPKVFKDYFSTDPLTQWEAILLGRELSKLPQLSVYGKEVTSFRLFDGRTYNSEEAVTPTKIKKIKHKGGRMK